MNESDRITITLPPELSKAIRELIASGQYEDELAVIGKAVEGLDSERADLDRWILDGVTPAWEDYQADPAGALTSGHVAVSGL